MGGVYVECRVDNPVLSTVHAELNIHNVTVGLCLGYDNIGFQYSIIHDNTEITRAFVMNVAEVKIGFEKSVTVQWDDGNKSSTSVNVSLNGWFIAACYAFAYSGQWIPGGSTNPVPYPVPS